MKRSLKNMDQRLAEEDPSIDAEYRLALYAEAIDLLKEVSTQLNEMRGQVRLGELRSVRSYVDSLQEYQTVLENLAENQLQLDKVRHDLGNDLGELSSLEQGLALLHYLAVSIADQARHQLGDRDDRVLLAHLHEHTGRRAHLSSHARNTGVAHYVYARLTLDATPAR